MSSSTEAKETQSTIQLDKLLSVCLDTATKASAIIRDVMASGRNVSTAKDKSEHGGQGTDALDPQTEADLRSQHLIVASLSKMYPNLNIVGEEGKLEYKPECAIDAKTDLCSAIIEEAKKSGTSLDLPIADVRFYASLPILFTAFFPSASICFLPFSWFNFILPLLLLPLLHLFIICLGLCMGGSFRWDS